MRKAQPTHLALKHAVELDQVHVVEFLLHHSPTLTESIFPDNLTLLHLASFYGSNQILRMLADDGLNLNPLTQVSMLTPLMCALEVENIESVKILLQKGAYPNLPNAKGQTPLHRSISLENYELTKTLLFFNACPNMYCSEGKTPLHLAIEKNNLELCYLLLQHGALFDVAPEDHPLVPSPAQLAFEKDFNLARKLYEFNAMLNTEPDPNLWLEFAIKAGSKEGIDYLIKRGATFHASSPEGALSLFHFVIQNGNVEILNFCIQRGADKNATDFEGKTLLHFSALRNQHACIQALLNLGVFIDSTDFKGNTALMTAASVNARDALEVLLNANATIELQNESSRNALYVAAEKGHSACVRTLLRAGANRELLGPQNNTPLLIATKNGHIGVVQALRERHQKEDKTPLF